MKKTISLLLTFVLLLSCALPAFAKQEVVTPVIIISGMGAFETKNNETGDNAFPPSTETIIKSVLGAVPSLAASVVFNKWDILGTYGAKPIHDLFEAMRCDENGEPVYDTYAVTFPGSAANHELFTSGSVGDVASVAAEIGYENVYFFYYDWRKSALDIADELKAVVDETIAETGSEKVSFLAESFGGTVASAYLYKYGSDNLKNVVYASCAQLGTDLATELFTGNMEITIGAILDYVEGFLVGNELVYEMLGLTGDVLSKYGSFAKQAVDSYFAAMVEALREPIYSKILMDTFIRFPGMWGLMNSRGYEKAKELMVPYGSLSESFVKKTDEYMYNVQMKLEDLIAEAEANGVNVYMIGSYNYSGIPVTDKVANHTDCLIDTYLMTGYATVADYGKTLSADAVSDEKRVCTDSKHDHVSTDGIIDASTAMLPERTWFIKNMSHVAYSNDTQTGKLAAWIVTSDGVDVYSDSRFPQFVELDTETGAFTSLTSGVTIASQEKEEGGFFEKLSAALVSVLRFLRNILLNSPLAGQ